jgi:sulfide:quinone oxidoreductase
MSSAASSQPATPAIVSRQALRHRIVIVGGGTAGITVAARLRRAGQDDIAIIEPSSTHDYQPLWTLVGGGRASISESRRREADVMPAGVRWLQDWAEEIDPETRTVRTRSGVHVHYDALVVCPGIQLDWDAVPGLSDAIGHAGVSSVYSYDTAPAMWELIRPLRGGTALFTMPSGAIKCAGAPQKIAYLASDWWRLQGVLNNIHVILALPGDSLFGVPEFREVLERVIARYGIDLRLKHELVEIRPHTREAVLIDRSQGDERQVTIPYDMLHAVPPQSAPDWIKRGPLSDGTPAGYVAVDKHTLQHIRYPNIFALGDAGNTPNSKTGAAIRKQAPVVVKNLLATLAGAPPPATYNGYASCPVVTARNRVLLAEFDYSMRPAPSIPLINTAKERYDMWLLKRYGLPWLYWHGMLKGRM